VRSTTVFATVLFAFVPCSFEAKATSAVAVWTPDATFIAADATMIHYENKAISWKICKINVSGKIFWVSAGISRDVGVGFSVKQLVDDAMARGSSLAQKVSIFESEATKGLTVEMNMVYKSKRDIFNQNFNHRDVLEVMFSGYENGVNYLLVRSFSSYFDFINKTVKIITNDRMNCPCDDNSGYAVGNHSAIDSELRQNPGLLNSPLGTGDALRQLIGLEIALTPRDVGPPVSIVEIRKGVPRWIDEGACGPGQTNKK